LDDALEQLVKAEMIFRRGSPPDAEYIFKHALVQDAAYGTLLRSRRQLLHARITAALEGQFPEMVEMQPELLARHCTEAGLADRALGHWLKAAQQSIARWALTEAVAQLRKGLEIVSALPDGAARLERELDLQITLGQVFILAKGYAAPEPAEAYARAHQLCEQLNRPRQLIAVLDGQMSLALFRGDLKSCRRIGEEQLRLGEARQDPVWIVLGCVDCGSPCLSRGEFKEARHHFERGLGLYDPEERAVYAALAAKDPQVILLIGLSWSLLSLGHLDQARLPVEAAQAEARRLAHPINLGWAGYCMMSMQLAVGAYDVALEASENLLGLVEKYGLSQFQPAAIMARGRCLVAHGQHRAGIELFESGLAVYRASGARTMLPAYLAWLAEALLDAGQPKQGLERIAESAEEVEATGERATESWMHCVHGKLLLAVNDTKAADESSRQAFGIARRQNARLYELLAATNLARLWRDQGNDGEARELLAPVYDWFTDGFDTPVLRDAKALLEQLAV
jgi:predicted ATPase